LGKRLAGASIIPWEGHSLGRASSCKPTQEILQKPLYTDEQKARDYAQLAGLDLTQVEAATEDLLSAHWPLVWALAEALVEHKVVSGRHARQILFGAYRKQFRRWRIVAEKDRRNQQAWAAELRQALGQVAGHHHLSAENAPWAPCAPDVAVSVAASGATAPLRVLDHCARGNSPFSVEPAQEAGCEGLVELRVDVIPIRDSLQMLPNMSDS
jgi:hypothetical protein